MLYSKLLPLALLFSGLTSICSAGPLKSKEPKEKKTLEQTAKANGVTVPDLKRGPATDGQTYYQATIDQPSKPEVVIVKSYAMVGYKRMLELVADEKIPKDDIPYVVSAFYHPGHRKIYISSGVKGVDGASCALDKLQGIMAANHRSRGNCAEIAAIAMAGATLNEIFNPKEPKIGGMISAYGRVKDEKVPMKWLDPCPDESGSKLGCQSFMTKFGIAAVGGPGK